MGRATTILIGAVFSSIAIAAFAAAPPAPAPPVAAAPMKSPGPIPTYPRLTAFPDAGVKARVNALLAAKEKEDRTARTDCRKEKSSGGSHGSYEGRTEVTYLSPRYLSVNVVSDYDCGSAYPNDGIETPVTYDLAAGTAVDWAKAFKPGFLPPAEPKDGAPPSALTKLYRAGYPKDTDPDCRKRVTEDEVFDGPPILWLDRKRGLVVQPDFPHVIAVCAEAVALSPAALAPYLRDPAMLADLRATVAKK